jgi:hypothetical protein
LLPLYPELKEKIEKFLMDIARQAADNQLSVFSAVTPRVRQHEGNRLEYMTVDGKEKSTDYHRAGVGFDINQSDVPDMTLHQAVELVKEKGAELGLQEASFFYKTLNESLAEVGNLLNAGGRSLTVDLLLQMLGRIRFPFDKDDNPLMPTLLVGPDLKEKVIQVFEEINEDADAQERLKGIIDQKREEWNAWQDSGKLVD